MIPRAGVIGAIPLMHERAERVSSLTGRVVFFTLAAVTFAWLANLTYAETVRLEAMRMGGMTAEEENKSTIYYLLHGGEVATILVAGLLGVVNGGYARLDRLGRLALCVLVLSSIIWALVTYNSREIFSKTIFESTGPFVWLSALLVLVGTERSLWPSLRRLVNVLMIPTILLAFRCLLQSHYMGTSVVWRKLNIYFLLLLWYGGWSCLARTRRSPMRILADLALIALLTVMALSMARRSWVIIMILFTGMYAKTVFEQFKAARGRLIAWRVVLTTVLLPLLLGGLAVAPFLKGNAMKLRGRLGENTRIGQYEIFFSQVPPRALVLGLGPRATYNYGPGTRSQYRFFDNGFLWMAFVGGLPILVSYCVLVIRPGLVALFRRRNDWQSAASAKLLFIWTLALGGLGVYCAPSLNAYSYLILLMAGSCYASDRQRIRRGNPITIMRRV